MLVGVVVVVWREEAAARELGSSRGQIREQEEKSPDKKAAFEVINSLSDSPKDDLDEHCGTLVKGRDE